MRSNLLDSADQAPAPTNPEIKHGSATDGLKESAPSEKRANQITPRASDQRTNPGASDNTLSLRITKQAPFFHLENRSVNLEELRSEFMSRVAFDSQVFLSLQADVEAPFEQIVKVIDLARSAGISRMTMSSQAPGTTAELSPTATRALSKPPAAKETLPNLLSPTILPHRFELRWVAKEGDAGPCDEFSDPQALGDGFHDPLTLEPKLRVLRHVLFDETAVESASIESHPLVDRPQFFVNLTPDSAEAFAQLTATNLMRQLAIILDGKALSAPYIISRIPNGKLPILVEEQKMSALAKELNSLHEPRSPSAGPE